MTLWGGTLELDFAEGVEAAGMAGRTWQIFDWTGVVPDGAFEVVSNYRWDVSELYSSGTVTLLPQWLTGDFNGDGEVNPLDIDGFVLAMTNRETFAAQYPEVMLEAADPNGDGVVNPLDIDAFTGC